MATIHGLKRGDYAMLHKRNNMVVASIITMDLDKENPRSGSPCIRSDPGTMQGLNIYAAVFT